MHGTREILCMHGNCGVWVVVSWRSAERLQTRPPKRGGPALVLDWETPSPEPVTFVEEVNPHGTDKVGWGRGFGKFLGKEKETGMGESMREIEDGK